MNQRGRKAERQLAAITLALAVVASGAEAVSLEQAVGTAVATHPQVRSAEAGARAAGQDVRQARGAYFPSLDVVTGIAREHTDIEQIRRNGGDASTLTPRQFGVVLSQLVFDGFATPGEVERRVALLEAAEHTLSDTRLAIAFRAVQVYVSVLQGQALVALARRNVEDHERVLADIRLRVERRFGQRADLQQAEGRLALARSALTAREGALREAEANYLRVIGEPVDAAEDPTPETLSLLAEGRVDEARLRAAIAEARATAALEHPALAGAADRVDAAGAAVKVARGSFYPRVDLELRANRDDQLEGVAGTRDAESIGLVARWNLFRGGADRAAVRASHEREAAAVETAADVKRVIDENCEIALKAKATSEERLAFLAGHVSASEETLESYRRQFELGRRTLLDVLNAQNELFTARSSYAVGRYEDLLNHYFIEASKGVLNQSLGVLAAGE